MTGAPERSEALQAFRTDRSAGLPPPPARLTAAAAPAPEVAVPLETQTAVPAVGEKDTFTVDELLRDPVRTCRRMAVIREDMAARPLNVDLTPETASALSERCRELRLKKKDVVEVLLRAWLKASSQETLP